MARAGTVGSGDDWGIAAHPGKRRRQTMDDAEARKKREEEEKEKQRQEDLRRERELVVRGLKLPKR